MSKVLFKSFLIIIISLIGLSGSAQQTLLKIAHKQFYKRQYVSAQKTYLKVIKTDYRDAELFKNLGDSYYYNSQFKEASKWYKEYIESYPDEVEAEYFYKYAQSLKSNNDYEQSNKYMDKFLLLKKEDIRANLFNNKKDYLKRIDYQSGRFKIKNESINSEFTDFGAAFYGKYVIFSSSRDTLLMRQRKHKRTEESFLELYQSVYDSITGELSDPTPFSKELSTKFHESSPVFTNDGNTIYFTRNNLNKNELNRLKIFRSHKSPQDEWSLPESLSFNSDAYSTAHPALSKDGKTLYFSSDMPGGFGMSDIYQVSINEDGSIGDPINLGNEINTEGKETFPFISEENELYFSSDGHPGLGGLDVFVSNLITNPKEVINVGQPVNGPRDDFAFVIDEITRMGYFSSNRDGGIGGDDIYSFTELFRIKSYYPETVVGFIKDKKTQEALAGARVAVYDSENKLIDEMVVDEDGRYFFSLKKSEKVIVLKVSKDGYRTHELTRSTEEFSDVFESSFELEKANNNVSESSVELESAHKFVLLVDPKHFDSTSNDILLKSKKEFDRIIALMKNHSEFNITIKSYINNDSDTIEQAENRAKLVMRYFVENGISEDRLTAEGVYRGSIMVEKTLQLMMDVEPVKFGSNSKIITREAEIGLSKVIKTMNTYPDMKVQVQGHTDSKGSKQTNIQISINRAQSAINYLITKGISKNRLKVKGFGESKLINECSDGVPCTLEQHQLNRRCDFIIIN